MSWLVDLRRDEQREGRLGHALDLACGQGRHTRVLLELGYRVVAADIARSALLGMEHIARGFTDRLDLAQVDVDEWPFGERVFDAIVQVDFLQRTAFDAIKRSTAPRGVVLVDTFLSDDEGTRARLGPHNPAYRLELGELEKVFGDWQILRREVTREPGPRAALLARRPA